MYRVEDGVLQERNAASAIPTVSTPELRQWVTDGDAIIVNLRPLPAYNASALRTKCAAVTSREPSPFLRNGSRLWMTPSSIDC